jgi:hypothetical protein
MGEETIKFNEYGLMKIAPLLEDVNGRFYIRFKDKKYQIPILENLSNNPAAR